jgi:hypothetical protein
VERLVAAQTKDDKDLVKQRVQTEFESLLKEMEFNVELNKKGVTVEGLLQDLLDIVIPFAQMLAGQRAIFRLLAPSAIEKRREDPYMKNMDEDAEFDDLDEEQEGEVAYVVKPGLIKFGTGMGQKLDCEETILVSAFVQLVQSDGK